MATLPWKFAKPFATLRSLGLAKLWSMTHQIVSWEIPLLPSFTFQT
jgi:hypothetical protein